LATVAAKSRCNLVRADPFRPKDGPRRSFMTAWLGDVRLLAAAAALCGLPLLGNCTSNPPPPDPQAMAAPPTEPEMPASIRPEEIVGRWGYGSYHRDEDLKRTEVAARAQCGQPVVIDRGPGGGIMMYLADSAQLQELHLKGSPSGKNYIGPPGPAGGMQDREIVSFDGRTMVLRWIDPEVAGRYGIGVYVRCAPEGTAKTAKRMPPPSAPPPPNPQ
jgi:hypothetical protein